MAKTPECYADILSSTVNGLTTLKLSCFTCNRVFKSTQFSNVPEDDPIRQAATKTMQRALKSLKCPRRNFEQGPQRPTSQGK